MRDLTAFAGATLLDLSSATDDPAAPRRCCLLAPFDRPVRIAHSPRIRAMTRHRWMRHLRAQVSELHAFGELRAPQRAAIDILPFQLEPALAFVRGDASRLLLADEVGLGKTIQAGLALAELRQRGWCEHALIVTPAGLRHQWHEELRQRFNIHTAIVDAGWLAALAESLPFDVNPWTVEPVAIASIDFIKQPEVLRGLTSQVWDVLIVDEAHQATIASQRYDALSALAARARHVLLLTATPHAGDDRAYRALCEIGQLGPLDAARGRSDPILLFRRTRAMAGLPRSRRVHLLPVAPSAEGLELHRQLDAYLEQLWTIAGESGQHDVQLVAMVLAKRAFSCARALATSLERRMAGLDGTIETPSQSMLPLSLEEESDAAPLPIAPAFERLDDERAVLQRLIAAAHNAAANDRKLRALERLVGRVREPLIIFTEYRDTLEAIAGSIGTRRVATSLHGGQTTHERRAALQMFTAGEADILIATDAGSEGLNLHGNCRVVVNLELPWNPIRLEQRIGRVDRIGQRRTVHAINLLAEGTAERTVLASLLRRIDRIRMSEIAIAACVINNAELPPRRDPVDTCTTSIDLSAEATTEAHRLAHGRSISATRSPLPDNVVPVCVRQSSKTSLIAFFRVRLVTGAGRLIEDTLVPVCLPLDRPTHRLSPSAARELAELLMRSFGHELLCHARAHGEQRAHALSAAGARSIAQTVAREHAIAGGAARGSALVQAGLFDGRALKQKWVGEERRDAIRRETDARAHLMEAGSRIRLAHDPELVMLLISCSQG